MNRTIIYNISKNDSLHTVKSYLKEKGYSSQNLIELKKRPESVLIDGNPSRMNYHLQAGETLTIHICEETSSEKIIPVELPLDIVYEDEDLLVINKPAGMPIHPSMNHYDNSVANALAWYFAKQNKPFIFRCINRLDRDTSGLTIIAKHMVSAGILGSYVAAKTSLSEYTAFQTANTLTVSKPSAENSATNRLTIDNPASGKLTAAPAQSPPLLREYLAIVRGSITPSAGTISAPISRKEGSILEREIDFEKGEPAVTHYHLLEEKNGHSLISLQLETGRTHQIRVHMKYIGFPLIGDYLYNPDMEYITRQALHSHRLAFVHPITGKPMEFTAPLPEDMRHVLGL